MEHRQFAQPGSWSLAVVCALLWAGCQDPAEALVRVQASDAVTPDALRIEVYAEDGPGPLLSERRVIGALPQTFLMTLAEGSVHRWVRVRVVGLVDGIGVAAGDAPLAFPEDGRAEVAVTLVEGCERVRCPGLEQCDPTTLHCDSGCASDLGCDTLMSCGEVVCNRPAGADFGRCQAVGEDADGDSSLSRACPYSAGDDCDDADPRVPTAVPVCAGRRDRNCDGFADERGVCTWCATPGSPSLGDDFAATAGHAITAVAGVRETTVGLAAIHATDDAIFVSSLADGAVISEVAVAGVTALALEGDTVAVATGGGLVLGRLGREGALRTIGTFDAGGRLADLSAVALTGHSAWVSGANAALARVDVQRFDAPRLGAEVLDGAPANALVAAPGVVCALTSEAVSCFDDGGVSLPLPPTSGVRAFALSVDGPVPHLVLGGNGLLRVVRLEASPTVVAEASPASEVIGLALASQSLISFTATGVAIHDGWSSMEGLQSSRSVTVGGGLTVFGASIEGGTAYALAGTGARVAVVTIPCLP